jgi:diguanylate cyclase (GGDEF)-like protein
VRAHRAHASASHAEGRLSAVARIYLLLLGATTVGLVVPLLARIGPDTDGWSAFAVVAAGAAAGHVFSVSGPRNQSFDAGSLFLLAGVLLLPLELVALLGVAELALAWLKVPVWYKGCSNVCMNTLTALSASSIFWLVQQASPSVSSNMRLALATVAACLCFALVGNLLLATTLRIAAGHPFRRNWLLRMEGFSGEVALNSLGVAFAQFWQTNPWLAAFAILPLLLVHRSLHVPQLQEEARADPKTGLSNARHFEAALEDALRRCERAESTLSVIVADLDLLRGINNSYGHLAGDAVLRGVASALRRELRQPDTAARIGGEEFAVLLPGASITEAREVAERIRVSVAASVFSDGSAGVAVRATLSAGVAERTPGVTGKELLHQADLALYEAKAAGRNKVVAA